MKRFTANCLLVLVTASVLCIFIRPAAARNKKPKSFTPKAAARQVAKRVNQIRKQHGLRTLKYDPRLGKAALLHSTDMKKHEFFGHNSPVKGHRTFFIRAKLFKTNASAENIAKGPKSPGGVVAMWMKSKGHRKVMLNPKHRRIGVGKSGNRWTQLFGR